MVHVNDHLTSEDRFNARAVCKNWSNQFGNDHFNIHILLPHQIQKVINHFKGYHRLSLTIHKCNKLNRDHVHQLVTGLPNLYSVDIRKLYHNPRHGDTLHELNLASLSKLQKFSSPFALNIEEKVPHLTYLDVHQIINNFLHQQTIVQFPKLEVYSGDAKGLSLVNPATLTAAKLRITYWEPNNRVVFNNFSRLKKAHLWTEYFEALSLVDLDAPNLEELDLNVKVQDLKINSTRLTRLAFRERLPCDLGDQPQLKSMAIYGTAGGAWTTHLAYFSQLEELKFHDAYLCKEPELELLNSNLLTSLELHSSTTFPILRLTNLRALSLDSRSENIEDVYGLVNLEQLTIRNALNVDVDWIGRLTALTSLDLQFTSLAIETMDLAALTRLRVLVLPIHSNKRVDGLETLTNLERLEAPFIDYNALDTLIKLTRLANYEVDSEHRQLSNLTRLRELDFCFTHDEEIIALTQLQHLTYLICRTRTCNTMHLTLLTRLQSLGVSNNVDIRYDWPVRLQQASSTNKITSKLPYLITPLKYLITLPK